MSFDIIYGGIVSLISEFKEFAMKGSVIDLAVGMIIGAEFGKIVNSMVVDMIMPPIGLLIGSVDFKNLYILLKDGASSPAPYATLSEATKAGAITLNIGSFFTNVISFVLVAMSVFIIIKVSNRIKKQTELK